jgi:hypothetical protein
MAKSRRRGAARRAAWSGGAAGRVCTGEIGVFRLCGGGLGASAGKPLKPIQRGRGLGVGGWETLRFVRDVAASQAPPEVPRA